MLTIVQCTIAHLNIDHVGYKTDDQKCENKMRLREQYLSDHLRRNHRI